VTNYYSHIHPMPGVHGRQASTLCVGAGKEGCTAGSGGQESSGGSMAVWRRNVGAGSCFGEMRQPGCLSVRKVDSRGCRPAGCCRGVRWWGLSGNEYAGGLVLAAFLSKLQGGLGDVNATNDLLQTASRCPSSTTNVPYHPWDIYPPRPPGPRCCIPAQTAQ
jgi:hypothetical protein